MSVSMNDGLSSEDKEERALLTDAERRRMLADIAAVSLAVGAQAFPSRAWNDLDVAHDTLRKEKSPAERLHFLHDLLPALTQAVEQLARVSSARTIRQTHTVPPARARRVEAHALLSAVRRGLPIRSLEETVSISTQDTPENRAVRQFLRILFQDAQTIRRMAASEEEEDATRAADQCVTSLRGLLHFPIWSGVEKELLSLSLLPSRLGASPACLRIAAMMRAYAAAFCFDWDTSVFRLPPRAAWRIYETWTALTTVRIMMTLQWRPQAEEQTLFAVRRDRLCPILETGHSSRIAFKRSDGQRAALTWQPTFAAGERSRGRSLRPDLTLERAGRLFVLDAKWKEYALPGDEGDDINQMHAYRDAIIGVNAQPAVQRAWCLFPGSPDGPRRVSIAYGAEEESIVGALCLRPGNDESLDRLRCLLAGWLKL